MDIDVTRAAQLLASVDCITILAHQKPDGDTLGSAFGLMYALQGAGKRCRVLCSDGYPQKYSFIYAGYQPEEFDEQFVVAVDLADPQLMGSLRERYESRVDLCIDHHQSNNKYARENLIRPGYAATCELVYMVLINMNIKPSSKVATALYTGLSTDTGCFRFGNTTASTHICAAELIGAGADFANVNRLMFETVSLERMKAEVKIKSSLEVFYGGKCAVMYITDDIFEGTGLNEYDLEGMANLPRQLEGVEVGILIRERKETGECRVSLRSSSFFNVSAIAAQFGGGGHIRAAGCTITGSRTVARDTLLAAIKPYVEQNAI